MPISRRPFLKTLAASMTAAMVAPALAATSTKIRAVAFDAFAIFDPRPLSALAEHIYPGHGAALISAWRARQFDYAWLSLLAGRYQDFSVLTDAALVTSVANLGLELSPDHRRHLNDAYLKLPSWPDVEPVLSALRSAGIELALLSNFAPMMLEGCVASSGLKRMFSQVISTDAAKTYKPDPRAYQLGVDALRLSKAEIAFVAFAGWDAFGAKSFGYPTFWNNRIGQAADTLGPKADVENAELRALLRFVGAGTE
jgi:2-haloacid dehalogenase